MVAISLEQTACIDNPLPVTLQLNYWLPPDLPHMQLKPNDERSKSLNKCAHTWEESLDTICLSFPPIRIYLGNIGDLVTFLE